MGIAGLLPNLKSIQRHVHVREYNGKTVAVDGYCWLHRGAFSCSRELCEGRPTRKYIDYCVRLVEMMKSNGVTPLMVFDGGKLPMKVGEEQARDRSRREQHEKALGHLRAGNMAAASECFQRAVDVTPRMAAAVIAELAKLGVRSIVAPYEADCQMAFLALHGHVHAIVTEDSDLLVYGVERVLFKMDHAGHGVEIRTKDLPLVREMPMGEFSQEQFMEMCVMSGCDYLPSVAGIGLKKAHGYIRRFRAFSKAVRHMRLEGFRVDRGYEAKFHEAILTFRHQWVYCPRQQALTHLHPPPHDVDPAALAGLIGVAHPADVAQRVAHGELDPVTLAPFDWSGGRPQTGGPSEGVGGRQNDGWTGRISRNQGGGPGFNLAVGRTKSLPAQKNTISNYFDVPSSTTALAKPFAAPRLTPNPNPGPTPNNISRTCSTAPLGSEDDPSSSLVEELMRTSRKRRAEAEVDAVFSDCAHVSSDAPNLEGEPERCRLQLEGYQFQTHKRRSMPSLLPRSTGACGDDTLDITSDAVLKTAFLDQPPEADEVGVPADISPVKAHPMAWKLPMKRILPQAPGTSRSVRSTSKFFAAPAGTPSTSAVSCSQAENAPPNANIEKEPEQRLVVASIGSALPQSILSMTSLRPRSTNAGIGSTAHCSDLGNKAAQALDRLEATGSFDRFRCGVQRIQGALTSQHSLGSRSRGRPMNSTSRSRLNVRDSARGLDQFAFVAPNRVRPSVDHDISTP